MKPIPKQLHPYFPSAPDPARPWWVREDVPMGFFVGKRWTRSDGRSTDGSDPYTPAEIDAESPLQPPPALVGQTWAIPTPGGGLRVGDVSNVYIDSDGTTSVHWLGGYNGQVEACLHRHGFLIRCPFGYAPWAGPEEA